MAMLISWADIERLWMDVERAVARDPEIAAAGVGAVLGAIVGGVVTHGVQVEEERVFPCLYSGVQRLPETHAAIDYYAAVNDMVMSITEAWNARTPKEKPRAFLQRLTSGPLASSARKVRLSGADLLARLETHRAFLKQALRAASHVSSSWSYRNHHNYRTETYTVTTTDSQGRTRTQTRTRRVYVNTDHYFNFFPERARHAQTMVEGLCANFPREEFYQPRLDAVVIEPASELRQGEGPYRAAQGQVSVLGKLSEEEAVERTILEDDEVEVTPEEIKDWLNVWLRCAHVQGALVRSHNAYATLTVEHEGLFGRVLNSNSHYHYRTRSKSHGGPDGYSANESIEDTLGSITQNLQRLFDSLEQVAGWAQNLEALGDGKMPAGWERGSPKIARRALEHAVQVYEASFPGSTIDMNQLASLKSTVLGVAIGTVVGAAVGFGAYMLLMTYG